MAAAEEIRELVREHLVPDAPLSQALLLLAGDVAALERGVAAVVERVERVEADQLVIG